ncbi:MAG: VOC family protein [Deltaproteobacteria bacterium]|nr:VOC family protein [Deltaproteobacteria bacterium]
MISRIEHISLAVNDYEKAVHFFQNILGAIPGAGAEDSSLKFYWQIFSLGDMSRLELIKPTGEGSFLDNFLSNKKDGGVHHITLQTSDIQKTRDCLEKENIPYFGYNDFGDVWKELFIHPKDAFGILIQIAQLNPDDYLDDSVKFTNSRRWSVQRSEEGCELHLCHPGGGKVELKLTDKERKALIKDLTENG